MYSVQTQIYAKISSIPYERNRRHKNTTTYMHIYTSCCTVCLILFNRTFKGEIRVKRIKIDSAGLCDRMIKNTQILTLHLL